MDENKLKRLVHKKIEFSTNDDIVIDQLSLAHSYYREYFLAKILELIFQSSSSEHFILKGGLLVQAMTNVAQRPTADIDLHVEGFSLESHFVKAGFLDLSSEFKKEGMFLKNMSITRIMKDSKYPGVQITATSCLGQINERIGVDLTVGNPVTYVNENFSFLNIFENKSFRVATYAIEQLIGEKLVAIIASGELLKRYKDLYDLWLLLQIDRSGLKLDNEALKQSINETAVYYGTPIKSSAIRESIFIIENSLRIEQGWKKYRQCLTQLDIQAPAFQDVLAVVRQLLNNANMI